MSVDYRQEAPPIVKDFLRFEKTNHNLRDKTINEYYLDLRIFLRFMKLDRGAVPEDTDFDEIPINDVDLEFIKNISKQDINAFIDYLRSDREVTVDKETTSLGIAATTTNRKIACLHSFFGYLCEGAEVLDKNPTIGTVTPITHRALPVYLTEDESRKLLDSIRGPYYERDFCIILIVLCCGLRVSEVVGINLSDIHTDGGGTVAYITIRGKGGKERQLTLPENCIKAINDYLTVRDGDNAVPSAKDALFLSQKHNRISVRTVQNMVNSASLNAGIRKISPHKLRHSAATMMMNNGVDIRTLQEILGHATIATTQIYTHVANDDIRTAISKGNPMSRY